MSNLFKIICDPNYRFLAMARHGLLNNMDDKKYLQKMFRARMGYALNIDNPVSFNEKIQWLKLNDRRPEYSKMVDKYLAKDFVSKIIGGGYIIPTIGVWKRFEDIDFSELPEQFVLKCTHDSGGLVVCRNKSDLDILAARAKIERSLKRRFYLTFREWAYKNVEPQILAEKYMEDQPNSSLVDYKFFCFNGKPKLLYISEGLEHHPTAKISFFDLKGKLLPFYRKDYKPFENDINLPSNFNEMLQIAERLSMAINNPFVRIDLYDIKGRVYFSEITFYPNAGMIPFCPEEWDKKLGAMIELPIQ